MFGFVDSAPIRIIQVGLLMAHPVVLVPEALLRHVVIGGIEWELAHGVDSPTFACF